MCRRILPGAKSKGLTAWGIADTMYEMSGVATMTIEITQENWKPYRVVMVTCVPCVVCRYNHSIGFSVLWSLP